MPLVIRTPKELIEAVNVRRSNWDSRRRNVQKWYDLIRLENDLATPNLESVISTDPRSGFTMASWLLQPKVIIYNGSGDGLSEDELAGIGELEVLSQRRIATTRSRAKGTLFGEPIKRLIDLMLATGWYCVMTYPIENRWLMNVWNPLTAYPDYNDEGFLTSVARRYTTTLSLAKDKIQQEGWHDSIPTGRRGGTVDITSMWWYGGGGEVLHAVVINGQWAKPPTPAPFVRIPVFIGPVGGLPDDGTIKSGDTWRGEVGMSLVGAVADLAKNYDKVLTFLQQLIRDTANPRWLERTRTNRIERSQLFDRGAVFRVEADESFGPLATPPLPAEARSHTLDIRQQTQRALFPDAVFGGVQGQISSLVMSQIVSVAQQVVAPFHRGMQDLLSQICTFNLHQSQVFMELGYEIQVPRFTTDIQMNARYEVTIPGDFLQRASTARLVNPEFRLAKGTIMDILFPEIISVAGEQAKINAEDAVANPIFRGVLAISEFQRAAQQARMANDEGRARLLDRAAQLLESQVLGEQPGGGGGGGALDALPDVVRQLQEGGPNI